MRIAVLGAGSWGSALAIACSSVADVLLWTNSHSHYTLMQEQRNNPNYLPKDIYFNQQVSFSDDLSACVSADLIIIATPVNAIREVLLNLIKLSTQVADLIIVSKGFESETGLLPHQIIEELIPGFRAYGVLIGPSFAKEVAEGLPTAITLAAVDLDFALKWMHQLKEIPNLRIYAHDDVVGSSVGAAVKNVLAIAVGISDGLALGYNARAGLITRSLNELASLVLALGGKRETIYGLTGVGDLILTCTSDLSRNRTVGLELAHGKKITEIIANLGHVAEGVLTAKEIYKKAQQLKIDMPIVVSVYNILYKNADINQEVLGLIKRQPKMEFSNA